MKTNNRFGVLIAFLIPLAVVSCKKENGPDDPAGKLVKITDHVTVNTTWTASNTYLIEGLVSVGKGATLIIEPGTVVKFGPSGILEFGSDGNATLLANGTSDKPILFTSSSPNPAAGAWGRIHFYEGTLSNSTMSFCIIEYAGNDEWYGALNIDYSSVSISNCTFRHNAGEQTIRVTTSEHRNDGLGTFLHNSFMNNSGHAIRIPCEDIQQVSSENAISCEPGYGVAISGIFSQPAVTVNKLTVPYITEEGSILYVLGVLTISPGVVMKFSGGSYLELTDPGAKLLAEGTALEPIVFTSASSSPYAGSWRGIYIDHEADNTSSLINCHVLYAGSNSIYMGAITLDNASAKISSCTFSHSANYGIYLMGNSSLLSGSTGNVFNSCSAGEIGSNQ